MPTNEKYLFFSLYSHPDTYQQVINYFTPVFASTNVPLPIILALSKEPLRIDI